MLSRFTQSKWRWAVLGLALVLAAVFGVMALTRGGDRAEAQPIQAHGASIAKNCSSPKRVGATVDCILVVGYNDDFGDDVSILQAWDVQDFGGDNVRVPAAGNLPILAVSGNTTCVAGGSLPCSIGRDPGTGGKGPNAGQVTFRDNTYVIQANDPRPLPDQGNVDVQDQCNGTPDPGCLPPPAVNRLQFTAQTIVITVSTELTKTASPTSGRAPLSVTYTYTERNTGTSPIRDVRLTDDLCSPVTGPTGGDTNGNGILDPGEAWTFTCSKTYDTCPSPIITNHVVATGTASDGLPAPEERAQTDVECFTVSTQLTKTASPTSGTAPLSVTYTYTERNTGTSPISGVSLSDDLCSPVTGPTGGDTNGNGILDPGEAWTFTCSKTFTAAGTYVNNVVATGISTVDGQPAPEERASATVVVSPPAPGRMTGGGSVFRIDGARVTRGFEIHCDLRPPNNIEVNWPGGNNFHMTTLTAAVCTDDPAIIQDPPAAPFDTFTATGTGKLNGATGATIYFVFVDAGEPGKNDTALIQIWDAAGNLVLDVSGFIDVGNLQAHKN
jgi:uncharacterized repeat protein (TIGR01451 family)